MAVPVNRKDEDLKKRKKKLSEEKINYLKQKRAFLLLSIVDDEKLADSLAEKAESNRNISLFIKSNELRKNIKEKKNNVEEIEKELSVCELNLKEKLT